VPAMFGPGFEGAGRPMAILLVAVMLLFTTNLLASVLVLHERGGAIAGLNGAAAIVNIVGDVLTVGVFHMGIAGPAVATSLAMLVLLSGFYAVAIRCVGVGWGLNPVVLLPVLAGLVPSLLLSGVVAVASAIASTLICAVLVVRLVRPFGEDDLEMVASLDMPAPLKRLALRGVTLASA